MEGQGAVLGQGSCAERRMPPGVHAEEMGEALYGADRHVDCGSVGRRAAACRAGRGADSGYSPEVRADCPRATCARMTPVVEGGLAAGRGAVGPARGVVAGPEAGPEVAHWERRRDPEG